MWARCVVRVERVVAGQVLGRRRGEPASSIVWRLQVLRSEGICLWFEEASTSSSPDEVVGLGEKVRGFSEPGTLFVRGIIANLTSQALRLEKQLWCLT